ncbi:hypothetical protein FRB95_002655 [Tulasnella sp. JGI-2019a]|nr:hypothetical protein FRB95_002655 [Tulasnella sp. JGI-2019a]
MLGARQRLQQRTAAPSAGSPTATVAPEQPTAGPSTTNEDDGTGAPPRRAGVLKLRGGPRSRPQVAWTDDVVDNEGAGRKKSKSTFSFHSFLSPVRLILNVKRVYSLLYISQTSRVRRIVWRVVRVRL